ncbi:MAG TPA: hypothetical protein VKD91_02295, partial [Pyrinomonadaceae bacterium]|nr:hypothetical protein [Pyrinomonadaceae bacterium]
MIVALHILSRPLFENLVTVRYSSVGTGQLVNKTALNPEHDVATVAIHLVSTAVLSKNTIRLEKEGREVTLPSGITNTSWGRVLLADRDEAGSTTVRRR